MFDSIKKILIYSLTEIYINRTFFADEFIKKMYARSTSGDWSEFGDKAKELKWVNHIVEGIVESSITLNPDVEKVAEAKKEALVEEIDPDGKPFTYLPRLNPKDVYFLYNPDGYYRMR